MSESITGDEAKAQANAVRQAARRAVLELQDDKALRAALRARPIVFRDFKWGDWVLLEKSEMGKRYPDQQWTMVRSCPSPRIGWFRNIMVAHRKNILRCAPEHVRHVTEEEKIVVESPESEMKCLLHPMRLKCCRKRERLTTPREVATTDSTEYGPVRRRYQQKSKQDPWNAESSHPKESSAAVLVRPPGCDTDDFAEMMSDQIIPQIAPSPSPHAPSSHGGGRSCPKSG